jgi:pilus assembly protein CpaE
MGALRKTETSGEGATRIEAAAFVRDPESIAFLETYLRESNSGPVHVVQGATKEAVAFLTGTEHPPRLLIVDLSGAETPLTEIDRLAEVCEPSIVVIAIGETENVHLFRELIRAGVADYVTKPLAPDLLDPYVRDRRATIAAATGAARRGKIVAITGGRGGVGATTLAVNAAWLLAYELKRRVALIDLDLHAGAACVQLGVEPGGLADALSNHARLDSLFLERTMVRHGSRLSVLSEETALTKDIAVPLEALDGLLKALADDYHFILIDLPRSFGVLHAHVFNQARARVIVCDRTLPALRDGARLLELGRQTNEPAMLVMNDHHPGLTGIIDDKTVTDALGRAPDLSVPYDRTAAQRGDNLGEALAADRGPMAMASRELVAALTGRARTRQRSWLRRMIVRGTR